MRYAFSDAPLAAQKAAEAVIRFRAVRPGDNRWEIATDEGVLTTAGTMTEAVLYCETHDKEGGGAVKAEDVKIGQRIRICVGRQERDELFWDNGFWAQRGTEWKVLEKTDRGNFSLSGPCPNMIFAKAEAFEPCEEEL